MAEAGDGAEQQASYQVQVSGAATQETDSDSTDAVSGPGMSKDARDQKSVGEASPVVSEHKEGGSSSENETESQEAKSDELKNDESSSEAVSPRDVLKMVYVDESEDSEEKPEEKEDKTMEGADISEMDAKTDLKEDEKQTNYEMEEEQENRKEEGEENSKEEGEENRKEEGEENSKEEGEENRKEEGEENRKEEEEENRKEEEEENRKEEEENMEEEESRMEAEEEDSRTSEEKSSFAAKLSASAADDLDEMMDIGTVDQMEQEALMKEEDEEQNRSPTNTNTVSTLEDGNSAEEEEEGADVKPSASDLMQSSSSPSTSAGSTGRDSSSPAAVVNGMKVVKLSFPRSDSQEGQTETEDRKSSPSPPLAKVKDEPVDEEYEQALTSSTSTASIKDEPAKGAVTFSPEAFPLILQDCHGKGLGHMRFQQENFANFRRLSLSEPSLLSPGQDLQLDGCSGSRLFSCLQMRPPPPPPFSKPPTLLPCRNCDQQQNQQLQSCGRPAYIHFSRAIRPAARPAPVRRHSHNPDVSGEMLQGDFRRRNSSSCQGETLFVVGKPCFLGCGPRPTAAARPAGRAQLHVFLPSEAKPEEADQESVDEGFMDELDCRITALKLQHTLTNNS